jgi:hypothetical protein
VDSPGSAETAAPGSETGGDDGSGDSAGDSPSGDSTTAESGVDGSTDGASTDSPTDADGSPTNPPDASTDAAADATPDVASEPPSCTPGCGVHSVCVQGTCTAANRVFVSSASFSANLGGHAGADAKCLTAATAANLGGAWKAWVSDSSSSPSARFTQSSLGYRLLDGSLVAASWASLTSGTLGNGIDLDETGKPVTNAEVWTGTGTNGSLYGAAGCNNFTTTANTDPFVEEGVTGQTTYKWTEVYEQYCDRNAHLYCFEQ